MRKLLLVALLAVTSAASAASLTETIDKTYDVKAGAEIDLRNVNGRVTVKAWDQPRVKVVAVKRVEAARDDVKDVMNALRVEIVAANGGLTIQTHHPRNGSRSFLDHLFGNDVSAEVTYDLMVPRTMNLDLTSVNGAIRVSDVTGRHDLETTNGRIEVVNCSGSLDASTTNGSINAELAQATKGQPMTFETTNGRITVTVPTDFAADVDAGTTNGSIHTDLPITTSRVSRNSLRGSINGGGTPVRMRTTNGGIEIRTAGKS